jgi:hypothetical protein
MNFFDKSAQWIEENFGGYIGNGQNIANQYPNFRPVDTPINSGYSYGGTTLDQVLAQAEFTLQERNFLLDQVDTIANYHIANTIKKTIIHDGFNDICGRTGISISYDDPENIEKSKRLTKDINNFIKKTKVLELLKDCIQSEGLNYCEIFWSTPVEAGRGITGIYDNMDIREHLAIYKNMELLGALKFHIDNSSNVEKPKWIPADNISHIMINYEKISIKVAKNFHEKYQIPEKVRCSLPLLIPAVDLIKQYNQLEQTSTALEIMKATQPIILQMGVNPDQDMNKSMEQLQNWQNVLNSHRNQIIDNLDTYDIQTVLESARKLLLVPRASSGANDNKLEPIKVDYGDTDLSKKLNDTRKTIALAVGVPEYYVAISSGGTKDTKEDSLLTNPTYSGMLTKIQQLVAKGLTDLIFKHLKYLYMNEDGVVTETLDKDKIETEFKSATSLNNRLENEEMMLNVEAAGNLIGLAENIAASPVLNATIDDNEFMETWQLLTARYPHVRKLIRLMTKEEIAKKNAENGDTNTDSEANSNNDITDKETDASTENTEGTSDSDSPMDKETNDENSKPIKRSKNVQNGEGNIRDIFN